MDDWIEVADAAELLGVGARQVRYLAESGAVPARRVGRNWLIDERAVRSRAAHSPRAGRPLSASMAWSILRLVQQWFDDAPPDSIHDESLDAIADRQVRFRLRQLLGEPVPAPRWERLLHSRAIRRRVWVHPGVLDRMSADARLKAGGSFAAAAHGIAISAAPPRRFYVQREDLDQVLRDYRAHDDAFGEVELFVVESGAAQGLFANAGPVPAAVALADLLDSDDSRERHVAAEHLERFAVTGRK